MASPVDAARQAALALVLRVTEEGQMLSDALPGIVGPLSAPERARAQRLATGTLRWMDRADRALGPFLRMKPRPRVLNALRLALYEVFVDGAAAHGAVGAAVDLVRADPRTAGQAGLTNGVLRNVLRAQDEAGAWDALPLPRLPKPLRKRLIAVYGKAAVEAMEAVFAEVPPLDLTPGDGDAAALAARVGGAVLPTGSVRLTDAGQVSALAGYEAGAWWVQDAAAAIPARVLAPRPGERVLDLCAAPGGKTLQLAAAGAEVTALDISPARMARLSDNLARCGLRAELVVGDARLFEAERLESRPFDAVLLDAPCSATGTIRRHPDLPQARAGEDLAPLLALQSALFDAAVRLVRPGGRIVYCTCSLLPEEGEDQLAAGLSRHPGLAVEPQALGLDGIDPEWIGAEGGLRVRPDHWAGRGGLDGFYIARVRRADG